MEIKEIKEKKVWEDFLFDCKEKTFLQSFNWGDFNEKMGDKVFRLGLFENNYLLATALVVIVKAKRGIFLFMPHGPNIREKDINKKKLIIAEFLEKLKEIAGKERASFIRIASLLERTKKNIAIFTELDFKQAPIHIHPDLTWELGLELPEEDLLKNMRKTTRYLIKKGIENKDIVIEEKNDLAGIEQFEKLYDITKDRHGFVPFPFQYLKNQFSCFVKDNQISVFLGKYKGEIVSGAIFVFWQDICFYHHGASSLKYPKIPVSYYLLWQAIREAKKRGCKKFNFWGIAPIEKGVKKNHPWAGLTIFKMGYGGKSKSYVKTQDFVVSGNYWLNFLIESARRIKRGL